jgi:pimeloyl-ACP methyl ester carboxylesterase
LEKVFQVLKWVGLGTVILLILGIGVSYVNHVIRLSEEKSAFPPPGKMIQVNGHQIHVYIEGKGEQTLVFIAGGGTSSPTLNYKPLFKQFLNDYRIVVIERSGYGWSDIGSTPRDVDTLLSENRKALRLAEINPPYVLIAHSMGALEAIFWANQFPEEVEAIIGLDPAVPEAYQYLQQPSPLMLNFLSFLARTGITRLSPAVCDESLAIIKDDVSAEEAEIFCAIFYKSTLTKNMIEESKAVNVNALRVGAQGQPDVPMLFFISDGTELMMENWQSVLLSYISAVPQGQYLMLDVGHYIHNHEPALIASESKYFMQNLIKGHQ